MDLGIAESLGKRQSQTQFISHFHKGTAYLCEARCVFTKVGRTFVKMRLILDQLQISHPNLPTLPSLSFALEKGKTLGLTGPSGIGKSLTALALLQKLRDPFRVSWQHWGWETAEPLKIAYIPQNGMEAFPPSARPAKWLIQTIETHQHFSHAKAREAALKEMESIGLSESVLSFHPHQYSGGMIQRMTTLIALALKPNFLIADEPTTFLDSENETLCVQKLQQAQKENSFSMLLITHQQSLLNRICDEHRTFPNTFN